MSNYDNLAASVAPEQPNKTKKLAIVGISSLILVAMVVGVAVGVSRHNAGNSSQDSTSQPLQTSMKAIQLICQPTDYRQECESALSSQAGNTTDPKTLMQVAFNVTVDRIMDALNHSSTLQAAANDPRTSAALQICDELLNLSIDSIRKSFDKFGDLAINQIDTVLDDLNTWLTANIAYQESCLDAFENTTGDASDSMKNALQSAGELSSNALAIINDVSTVLSSFQIPSLSRRLLSEQGFPAWVSSPRRRLLMAATPAEAKPDATVAQDGSGAYKTITAALQAVPKNGNATFVIYIKKGVYKESVTVDKTMKNVLMIGDGPTTTTITGSLNFIDGTPTFKTATVAIVGDGFMAKNLGFENTAGPEKHQAVALRVQSDKSVFYNCQISAYQDTLYVQSNRQFYRECTISGTIDFIFGDSQTILQNCLMLVRKPMANQQNIVTAQGRKDRQEASAIIIHNCTISADPAYYPFRTQMPSYLGRPWKQYSRTLYLQSQIDDLINPQGWLPWMGDFGLSTCFYAEVDNRGAGSNTAQRVTWRGVKNIDYNHAQMFSVERFIQGSQWLNPTGVPYIPGLLPMTEAGRIH